MTYRLLPRLGTAQAIARFGAINDGLLAGDAIQRFCDVEAPEAAPSPTGGPVASKKELKQWRAEILTRTADLPVGKNQDNNRFGVQLGKAISETIPILPADAGHDGLWHYLTLYVFPDVVFRRWPQQADGRLPIDRWVGAPTGYDRNYFRLSWRRWQAFGETLETIEPPLGEDEFGGLLERTAVARNKRLVRACALEVSRFSAGTEFEGGRMAFTRELMKLVSIRTGPYVLDMLPDEDLIRLVAECRELVVSKQVPRRAK